MVMYNFLKKTFFGFLYIVIYLQRVGRQAQEALTWQFFFVYNVID